MRRLLPGLLAAALLAPPAVALAHDPLDDVSGEEDLNQKPDEEKPKSHRKERQEQELAKEVQERDDTEFQLNQEKEDFLRDRSETREVLDAQRRRNSLSGGPAGRGRHVDAPKPAAQVDEPKAEPAEKPKEKDSVQRGDVDPTENTATPEVTNQDNSKPKSSSKKKKGHSDDAPAPSSSGDE